MRFSAAALVTVFAGLATAYTQPDYSQDPTGNPILTPGLNEQVPEGKPYTITWTPTAGDKVSLVLLRGPSTNVQPLETIVEDIDNSGSYTWTPSTSLTPDTTHYGLLLVVEGTGQYQYSTQFGISAAEGSSSSASSTVVVTESETTTICPETETAAPSTTITPTWVITTTICPETETTAAPTVAPSSSVPAVKPTTIKSTPLVKPTATASTTPTPVFNAAGRNVASFGAVMAGLFAFMAL
ncbi:hypothetical protein N7462_007099 [Penicillium macrosclerotiorum]|uniref:uncharacterized protein n=1 Tax=Penicillium macrosclerotiorum TaxID=303699 RepID=UPI002549290E|nr:uncharacterized protein N7462_007099 [Penicillium macrosclerotiorum]KAJ5678855.1 hypothetical protein N7462_007099 [Penicillium macrosclerotiorum]